jgi:sugar phosphate isomerase/epimerase
MKLSVSTYSLARWRTENNRTLEDTIAWIADAGVEGVEFSGSFSDDPKQARKRAMAMRIRCEKLGLRIPSFCVPAELLVRPSEQRKVVERLKHEVVVAEELGVASMRHDVTRGTGAKSFSAVLKTVVPPIREIADYAQAKGIKTSLENHGFYMQASPRVKKLIDTVAHENYGLTIDLGNFLCVNENCTDATRRLAKYVVMAHAKDFHVKPKKEMPATGWFATPTNIALRGAIAGHGVLDLPAQLKLLKNAGYNGFLSLEFEGMEEPTRAIALGLEYLRTTLKALSSRE